MIEVHEPRNTVIDYVRAPAFLVFMCFSTLNIIGNYIYCLIKNSLVMKDTIKKGLHILRHGPVKIADDQPVEWIRYANAGMQSDGNLFCLDHAIRNLPSGSPIVEIGSFCGLSTNIIRYLQRKYEKQNKLFTADGWLFEGEDNGPVLKELGVAPEEYRSFVKSSYMRNVEFFSGRDKPYTIEALSDDFFSLWSGNKSVTDVFGREVKLGGPISFAYIDGNHTYDFSRRDFLNTDRILEPGGFVFFDDSADWSQFGVARLMKEVIGTESYELVCKNPNYLFKKVSRP